MYTVYIVVLFSIISVIYALHIYYRYNTSSSRVEKTKDELDLLEMRPKPELFSRQVTEKLLVEKRRKSLGSSASGKGPVDLFQTLYDCKCSLLYHVYVTHTHAVSV